MGSIRKEVYEQHLNRFPEEEELLKPFLDGFYITWGRRRKAYNTELSVFFLNPEPFITETYGFTQELMLVYSPYPTVEPRTIQAAESFLTDDPGKGRVEKLNYFLISDDDNVEEWIAAYASVNQESKIVIAVSANHLRASKGDSWYVRNVLNQQMYSRDLFDYRLPLQDDTYFFGRKDILSGYYDSVKRSENRGVFGLRKTGKTSFLYKLERMIEAEGFASFFYYDCKSPSIRKLRWFELFTRIIKDVSNRYDLKVRGSFDEVNIADTFANLLSRIPEFARIVLVFDEIEYISPLAISDPHWHSDFVDFWQTFWTCQSRYRKISTIIAGVNPSVVEMDTIAQIQNPLFGIVSYEFLKGFGYEEMKGMIRTLGKRLGMNFDESGLEYLHSRYGGHPLLTRIACSLINIDLLESNRTRPIVISSGQLLEQEDDRDSELVFYCRHVVSELRQFYPDEYIMLEYLASGQTKDFVELATVPEYTQHLRAYGLLSEDGNNLPVISIPVIGRYVGLELARQEGRKTIYRIVESGERASWLQKRIKDIIQDLRFLEKLASQNNLPLLFGANSFPEADIFLESPICYTADDFDTFSNRCNRCFVESIELYGKSISNNQYFWDAIKQAYPSLFFALHRIKLYRHNRVHLELKPKVTEQLFEYLHRDLEGRSPSQVNDLYFVLQQCMLDGLLMGIQIEINRLN